MIEKRVVPMSHRDTSRLGSFAWPSVIETAPPPQAAAPGPHDWITGEPGLQDILGDPLVHAVLQRDGLSLEDLQRAIALGRRRLAPVAQHSAA